MTNDVENLIRSTLESTPDVPCHLTGSSLRQLAYKRQRRARMGSGALLAAASVSIGIGLPRLLDERVSTSVDAATDAPLPPVAPPAVGTAPPTAPASVAAPSPVLAPPAPGAAPALPAAPPASAPAQRADPCPPGWKPPRNAPPAPAYNPDKAVASVEVPAAAWRPAGELIANAEVVAAAIKSVGDDCVWANWLDGKLLDSNSSTVVYAGRAPIDSSGPKYPRALVVVKGRLTGSDVSALAVLSTVAGGRDGLNPVALTVVAVKEERSTQDNVVAVAGGMAVFVIADGGVTRAEYTYRDGPGERTVSMDIEQGIATSVLASGPNVLDPPDITKVVAFAGDKKIWDGPPVQGR